MTDTITLAATTRTKTGTGGARAVTRRPRARRRLRRQRRPRIRLDQLAQISKSTITPGACSRRCSCSTSRARKRASSRAKYSRSGQRASDPRRLPAPGARRAHPLVHPGALQEPGRLAGPEARRRVERRASRNRILLPVRSHSAIHRRRSRRHGYRRQLAHLARSNCPRACARDPQPRLHRCDRRGAVGVRRSRDQACAGAEGEAAAADRCGSSGSGCGARCSGSSACGRRQSGSGGSSGAKAPAAVRRLRQQRQGRQLRRRRRSAGKK